VTIDLPPHHPFIVTERARWGASLRAGDVFFADEAGIGPVGVAVLGRMDGEPYLDQISVRLEYVERGVGSALLQSAVSWAAPRGRGLWLNTYGHLSWNRPFYERRGFALVDERSWNPEMRAVVAEQRATLPCPEQRVVMFRPGH
jgi:GNAT superfamily N-acetyltransferase